MVRQSNFRSKVKRRLIAALQQMRADEIVALAMRSAADHQLLENLCVRKPSKTTNAIPSDQDHRGRAQEAD